MSEKLNTYSYQNFTCDSCQGEFQNKNAYSPAPSLSEADSYYTYCADCVEPIKKIENKNKKPKKSWGIAPINETTENIQSLNLDKRTLKKTGRTILFGTRVKQEWIEKLKSIAYEERLHYNETLEKALNCYDKHRGK